MTPNNRMNELDLEQVKSLQSEDLNSNFQNTNNKNFSQNFVELEEKKVFENAFGKESRIINKILIKPIYGVSSELQKDLAYNGAEDIYQKQKLRVMDEKYSEFFEKVNQCKYSLGNSKKSTRESHNKFTIKAVHVEKNAERRIRRDINRPHTSYQKIKYRNPCSFENSNNYHKEKADVSVRSQNLRASNKYRKIKSSRRSLSNKNMKNTILSTFKKD